MGLHAIQKGAEEDGYFSFGNSHSFSVFTAIIHQGRWCFELKTISFF